MAWFWESRGEGEFQTPEVSSIYEGWNGWEADLATGLSSHAEVFTREITQNFVDAAKLVADSRKGAPSLTFRFLTFTGSKAKELREKLGVSDLSDKYKLLDSDQRRSLKLPESKLLGGKDTDDLNLLIVTESSTSGMLGPWARDSRYLDNDGKVIMRRMRDALLSSAGSNNKASLGSYGEGKKAIIAASAPRTLITYTAFDSSSTDDGASRRLLGTTYWRPYNHASSAYSGLAMLGRTEEGNSRPTPLKNTEADDFVASLGLPGFEVRDASNSSNWGTSQIFLEPVVTAEEVRDSIERNWWPLIVDKLVDFHVIDTDTQELEVNPNQKPYLAPFIRGWGLLGGKEVVDDENETVQAVSAPKHDKAGKLALMMDFTETGWSKRDPETNRSIVALIRDGMLISYQKFPKSRNLPEPFVRGVYSINSDNDQELAELLRQVEPPLHNYWNTKHEAMDKAALSLAQSIYDSITNSVKEFRLKFVEEMVKQSVDLALFDEMLSVSGGSRSNRKVEPPTPPQSKTDWTILDEGALVKEFDENTRYAVAERSVTLKPNRKEQLVQVAFGWKVEGDSGKLEQEDRLFRRAEFVSSGFKETEPGLIVGTLKPGVSIKMKWTSMPYSELWTLQPFVQVTRLGDSSDDVPSESGANEDDN